MEKNFYYAKLDTKRYGNGRELSKDYLNFDHLKRDLAVYGFQEYPIPKETCFFNWDYVGIHYDLRIYFEKA